MSVALRRRRKAAKKMEWYNLYIRVPRRMDALFKKNYVVSEFVPAWEPWFLEPQKELGRKR